MTFNMNDICLLDMWLASTNTDYFTRLINIFKQVVVHIVNLPSSFDPTEVRVCEYHKVVKSLLSINLFLDDTARYQAQDMP